MKRYLAMLLCVGVLVCATACGGDASPSDDTATTQSTVTTTTGEGSTTSTSAVTTTTAIPTGTEGSSATVSATGTTTTATPTTAAPATSASAATSATTTVPSVVGSTSTSTTASSAVTTTTTTTTVTTKPTAKPAQVILPAVGSDIDVTNKKDRIRVSAASATYNADGTIAVSLTVKNYSSTWITEETDYVEYTCYDKSGKVVQKATKLSIGCIDTKLASVRSYTFDVPATTAEVRLTRSKIVYWTEWS